jgi:hypothetical protein
MMDSFKEQPWRVSRIMAERGRHTLIALESYFDGSWDDKDMSKSRYITLAGFATDDAIWAKFDEGWNAILHDTSKHPHADYLHMRELKAGTGQYSWRNGWNLTKKADMIIQLIIHMQTFDKERFRMFIVSVDLEEHRRYSNMGYKLPYPEEICVKMSPEICLEWYYRHYPDVVQSAHFFFDEQEPFRDIFERHRWIERSKLFQPGNFAHIWQMVKTNATASLKDKPGLQAADLMAWSTNRELLRDDGELFKYYAHFLRQVVPSYSSVIGEKEFRGFLGL